MNRYQAKLKIFNLVKSNPDCTVAELYWIWLGGSVVRGKCVGRLEGTTPDTARQARNIDARLSDLVKEGALIRVDKRYRVDYADYEPKQTLERPSTLAPTIPIDSSNEANDHEFLKDCELDQW